jgi:hypothetical protein
MDFRGSRHQVAEALLNAGDNAIAVYLALVPPLSPTVPGKYRVARGATAPSRRCSNTTFTLVFQ